MFRGASFCRKNDYVEKGQTNEHGGPPVPRIAVSFNYLKEALIRFRKLILLIKNSKWHKLWA